MSDTSAASVREFRLSPPGLAGFLTPSAGRSVRTSEAGRPAPGVRSAPAGGVPAESVPLKALVITCVALAGAVGAAILSPEALADQQVLAGGLALIPALLLAHYRGWSNVAILLGLGLIGLCAMTIATPYMRIPVPDPFLVIFIIAPYIAIALGAGWFGEVRRYQSELRVTQLQLIQSEKLDSVGRMAAGVAHEVKNPLMMILTGVRVLAKRFPDADDSTRQLLEDMADAVHRADRIIGGLLSYSRERELDCASADLNEVVGGSLLLVKHDLDRARIAVTRDLAPSMPMLTLDRFKIEQVLVNLLTNAVHAMGHDGAMCVRTSVETVRGAVAGAPATSGFRRGDRVAVLRIEDSGPGVPPEHLGKIFDPFFTTKAPGHGTGLGLSVSRQIVDMHGGAIDIANRDEGGARVTITFTLDHPAEAHHETTHSSR
jgi:signal transduction histidine kinase